MITGRWEAGTQSRWAAPALRMYARCTPNTMIVNSSSYWTVQHMSTEHKRGDAPFWSLLPPIQYGTSLTAQTAVERRRQLSEQVTSSIELESSCSDVPQAYPDMAAFPPIHHHVPSFQNAVDIPQLPQTTYRAETYV